MPARQGPDRHLQPFPLRGRAGGGGASSCMKSFKMPQRCLTEDFIPRRLKQIAQFEEYLYDNGIRMVKIFLHLSKAEQKKRFLGPAGQAGKELEVLRRGPGEPGPVGRLSGGLRKGHQRHRHPPLPLVRAACRRQVVHPLPGQRGGAWTPCSASILSSPSCPRSRRISCPSIAGNWPRRIERGKVGPPSRIDYPRKGGMFMAPQSRGRDALVYPEGNRFGRWRQRWWRWRAWRCWWCGSAFPTAR